MSRLAERIAKLEASRKPSRFQVVRTHILDCAPEDREERIAEIGASNPDALNIINVIIDPAENGIGL